MHRRQVFKSGSTSLSFILFVFVSIFVQYVAYLLQLDTLALFAVQGRATERGRDLRLMRLINTVRAWWERGRWQDVVLCL